MKKLFVLLVGCLLVLNASAAGKSKADKSSTPLAKGGWFIAPTFTNVGLNAISFKPEGSSTGFNITRFGIQGTGGYALSDKLALEGGIGFQAGKFEETSMSMFDIFAGARYYLFKNLYANADLMFATCKSGDLSYDGETQSLGKANALQLMLGVGYDFMLSEHFAFEPSISYAFSLSAKAEQMKFKLGVFSINLGFSYFF